MDDVTPENSSTNASGNATEWREASEMQTLVYPIFYYYSIVCTVVGLTGNSMVWVLIRSDRTLRKLPSNIYLLALAVMSSVFLLNVLASFLDLNWTLFCKTFTFLATFGDFASVWLIVLVCFERLVLLYGTKCAMTTAKAKFHVTVVMLLAVGFNVWVFITAEIREDGLCDVDPRREKLYLYMSMMDTVVCMMIPTIIIVISNVFVVIRLRTHLRRMPASPTVSFSTADLVMNNNHSLLQPNAKNNETTLKSCFSRLNSRFSLSTASSRRKKRKHLRYADVQLTRSLLAITSVFVALNLPNYLIRIYALFYGEVGEAVNVAAISMLYSHHAILFYLYIFWSPQMKRRLIPTALKLLECYCFKFPGDH